MLVELGPGVGVVQAVEVGEQVELRRVVLLAAAGEAHQVVHQDFGVDLLLGEQRWGGDDQVAVVLLVLAAPDQLRVEVPIAPLVGDADWQPVGVGHDWLQFGRRDVPPGVVRVGDGDDVLGLRSAARSGHGGTSRHE